MFSYDPYLVLLSICIAVLTSYAALSLASRMLKLSGMVLRYWTIAGALIMGTGIWAMHFIGMLAFHGPVPLFYDMPMTILSMLVALLTSYLAFYFLQRMMTLKRLIAGSLLMGAGIALMHYLGMSAITMVPPIRYDPLLVTFSVIIAVLAAGISLRLASTRSLAMPKVNPRSRKISSALVMGLAISGMHYTGMMAATFDPAGICISGPLTVGQQYLVPMVGFGTMLLLLSAVLITRYGIRTKAPQVESELQLAAGLFDTMAEGVMITDSEHHILSVNAFFTRITGYMAEEVVGEPCSRIFPDIGKPDILSAMSSANDSNRCWRGELVGHHKTGRIFPAQLSMSAINNKLAQQPSHLVIFTDITEYKDAIEALQYSENFARATIDALAANICVLDEKGNIIAVNQAWRNFSRTNCSGADEIGVGHNYLSVCESASGPYSEDALLMGAGLRAVLEGARTEYRLEYPCHSGPERRWFVARVTPFADNSRRVVITHQDITERKLAEIALRDSEERWKFALEGASEGVWDWNMQSNQIVFSKRWKEMLGYDENEIENKFEEWEKRAHPDDFPRVMAEVDRYIRGQSPDFSSEYRMRCKDGRWKWILSRGRVVSYDSKHNPSRMIGTHADITDRKEAELRQVRAVVDASPAATLLIDANGGIEYANEVASHIFGYRAMQLSGLDINTLVPLGACVANIFADQRHVSKANLELCGNHKTGRKIPLEASLSLVQMAGQSVVIASLVDTSGRKQAELERLRDIERQRDTLVREVHHRVKNNL